MFSERIARGFGSVIQASITRHRSNASAKDSTLANAVPDLLRRMQEYTCESWGGIVTLDATEPARDIFDNLPNPILLDVRKLPC